MRFAVLLAYKWAGKWDNDITGSYTALLTQLFNMREMVSRGMA
jgi:hypothetical protein